MFKYDNGILKIQKVEVPDLERVYSWPQIYKKITK